MRMQPSNMGGSSGVSKILKKGPMKEICNFLFVIGSLFFFSCSTKYTEQDLTVIDNLKLGQTPASFYKSCDSNEINSIVFLTKYIINDPDKIEDYALSGYYTDLFNFSSSSKERLEHIGIFYLSTLLGTDNITKLQVLLVHTSRPWVLPSNYSEADKFSYSVIDQNVNEMLLNNVQTLLIKKYGLPKDTIQGDGIPVFVFEKKEINQLIQSPSDDGKLFIWETKALIIKLYTGFTNQKSYYSIKDKFYWPGLWKINKLQQGNIFVRYGAYISYEIKPEVIKKLKLDNPNI